MTLGENEERKKRIAKEKKENRRKEKGRRNLLILRISISHFRRTRWKNHDCSTSSSLMLLLFIIIIIIIKNMLAKKFSKLCTFRTSSFIFVFFGEFLA